MAAKLATKQSNGTFFHNENKDIDGDADFMKMRNSYNFGELGGTSEDDFQREVATKTQKLFIGRQEAETEVFIDRLVKRHQGNHMALLYVVAEMAFEPKVVHVLLVSTLISRGANPSASNTQLQTPLHFAVKRNFRMVAAKLLENDALPHVRDKNGLLPLKIAIDNENDDIAALLLNFMPNYFVRSLFVSNGESGCEFSFHELLRSEFPKTVRTVLNCMIESYGNCDRLRVYYHVLDADESGRSPKDLKFNYHQNPPYRFLPNRGIRLVTRDLVLAQPEVPTGEVKPTQEELEDDPYFNSYAHFSIHEEMLKDKVRTESYRDFMYKNPEVFKDKLVLDVGCGTGILSMFAARAGAKHVFAVDQSEIIYQAMDIVSLADKITLIRGRLEDIDLPVEKVDIIISEWMGYFLLFESMLDTVLFARDKYLKLDGAVYPDRCTISLTCISDLDLYDKHVTYWNDVYGFSMGCMKTSVVREVGVEVVKEEQIATTAVVLKELDICRCGLADLQFSKEFTLTAKSDVPITAIVGYFDTFFEEGCSDKVSFSTGPGSTPTHWKQSVFLLDTPLNVKTGEEIQGKLTCRKNRKDPRSLNITVQLKDRYLTYLME